MSDDADARVVVVVGVLLVAAFASGIGAGAVTADRSATDRVHATNDPSGTDNVSEEAYVEPAPEPGDPYFEEEAMDGSWISYNNPRDEYRSPYLGHGSGKICVALFNEEGEPVAGETVPNTAVTIPTGAPIAWHSSADPITVEYPVTDRYDRPLDADQFGTDPELPQGDGYMDSHCVEFHGLPEDETIEYGEAQVEGEHADRIDVVGYLQQDGTAWDASVDPIADAEPIEEAGGWSYEPDQSHGQAIVVLQLDPPEDPGNENGTDDDSTTTDDSDDRNGNDETGDEATTREEETSVEGEDDGSIAAQTPVLGAFGAILLLSGVLIAIRSRRT